MKITGRPNCFFCFISSSFLVSSRVELRMYLAELKFGPHSIKHVKILWCYVGLEQVADFDRFAADLPCLMRFILKDNL